MGSRFMPYLQLALAMIIVGSSVVAGKMIAASLPVMLSSCLRFAIAAPVLMLVLLLREGRPKLPTRADMLTLFLQALCGVFLFSVFLLYGVQYTGAIEAGLITGTLPAVTAVLAVVLLRERLNAWQSAGIACAVLGAVLLNILSPEAAGKTSSSLLGIGLVFAAVLCEALFVVLGKRTEGRLSALTIATAMSVLGFLLFLPFALRDATHFDFSRTTLLDWSLVAYFGLVVSVGAFWLFYAGLARVPASVAGAFMAFLPLSAVGFSALILGEPVRGLHVVAGACVVVGIMLASVNPRAGEMKNSEKHCYGK